MIMTELAGKMRCPICGGQKIDISNEETDNTEQGTAFSCANCGRKMRLVGRVLETDPGGDRQLPVWDAHYQEEDQGPLIGALEAGFSNRDLLEAHYPMVRILGRLSLQLRSSIELGCGSGAFSLVLKKLGLVEEVTLLDYSTVSLKAAERLFERFGTNCNLVHSKLEDAPFSYGAFDLAFSAGVIEHYRTLKERSLCMGKHLELGKYALVQAPVSSPFYWLSRLACTLLNGGWPFGYEKPVSPGELRRLAFGLGARVLDHDHQYFTSFPLFTKLHWLPKPGWYTIPFANEVAVLAQEQ